MAARYSSERVSPTKAVYSVQSARTTKRSARYQRIPTPACASRASVKVAPTNVLFGKFLNCPMPTLKYGDRRRSAQGSAVNATCQKSVPEKAPCTWPSVNSTPNGSANLAPNHSFSIGSLRKRPQAAPISTLRLR